MYGGRPPPSVDVALKNDSRRVVMKRLAAVAATSVALLVPAIASAVPTDFRAPSPKPEPIVAAPPSDDGFDWGAAGVGAGAVGGLVLVAGSFAGAYRVRTRVAR
jgi:hypothetical protein